MVVIEGISASGKTTLCDGLAAALRGGGLPTLQLRDPGGSPLAEAIRELVPHRQTDRAAALLYAAARAQTVEEVVRPTLARGEWVVTARWTPSSLVYEGEVLGLGVETVRWLCDFSTAGVKPDRVLALTLDPALARARRNARDGEAAAGPPSDIGKRIQTAYARLEEMEVDGPLVRIDASPSPDVVVEAAVAALRDLLPDEIRRRIAPTV